LLRDRRPSRPVNTPGVAGATGKCLLRLCEAALPAPFQCLLAPFFLLWPWLKCPSRET
jgi:hypothetical protein